MKTPSQNKAKTFWNWFQDNQENIKNINNKIFKNQPNTKYWLHQHLKYYCPEISYIINFPKTPKAKTKFILTANGNPNYFKAVTDLIDQAPVLKNWSFHAFIHPAEDLEVFLDGNDEPFIMNDITIKASEAKFLPFNCDEKGEKFDILVYLKNYDVHCNTQNWTDAVYYIMQLLFGKNFVYQSINFVQLAQEPDENAAAIQLCLLENYIDSFRFNYGQE